MESDFVSARLNEWIDLIWGFKQRGPAAVDACNVFHALTYEGAVTMSELEDAATQRAVLDQIREFGQTPMQVGLRFGNWIVRSAVFSVEFVSVC